MAASIPNISKQQQAGAEEDVFRQSEAPGRSFNKKTILDLVGGVAHDFNNLLYPIIGYTEITLKSMPEGSPARMNLEEVLKAAGRAQDLIQQFLNLNYHGENKLKPLRIQCIIKEVLNFLKATQPNTIEISDYINEKCGFVLADPTQIHRIIMNLCTNACHAMRPSGGILEVSLGKIDMGAENSFDMDLDPGEYLHLTVRDTGQGIDSTVIDRIFDPFFTTKEENKGAGLGLFVVLGIVKGYGGSISVSSVLNKGTVIDVYLPEIDVEDKHWRQIESTDMAEGKITVEEFRKIREETTLNMSA